MVAVPSARRSGVVSLSPRRRLAPPHRQRADGLHPLPALPSHRSNGDPLPVSAHSPTQSQSPVVLPANDVDREPILPDREMAGMPALPASEGGGPVRPQRWEQKWPIASGTARLARWHAQSLLTMAAWAGDRTVALRVVTELVQNAVEHVAEGEVLLVLFLDEQEDLVVEVADQEPEFTAFEQAIAAPKQTGLGLVRALGGAIALEAPPAGFRKSVCVLLHASPFDTRSAPSLPVPRLCSVPTLEDPHV